MDIPARATLINKKSGLALDIKECDMSDGGWVIQWTPHGRTNQIFRLEPADGGHRFIAEHSGKALDVSWANQNADFAMQWGVNGSPSQIWFLKEHEAGVYRLFAKHSGKVLAVANASTEPGARVVQFETGHEENELWLLKAVP
ncbi:RICIN domain-containing protein [Nonomuraea sp. NPDC049684]|uniref:RICIN domain-containing protein n=1 Tax=Nonomuraea sp. NPDC049684 TaxID=3364356 RepID=UPI00379CB2EC